MANIFDSDIYFKERRSLEDIFLEYKPYSLAETLRMINVVVEEHNEKNELDDELITIDLKNKNSGKDISDEIENNVDDC